MAALNRENKALGALTVTGVIAVTAIRSVAWPVLQHTNDRRQGLTC
jgi:hypothetical protein